MNSSGIKDYYYILGIPVNANSDEIRTAYYKLSQKFHPDKNDGDKFFEERFKDIQEAYETLSDEAKRKIYNERLEAGISSSSFEKNETGQSQKTQQAAEPVSPVIPVRKKNRLKQTLLGLLAFVLFSSPAWLRPLIHELNDEEKTPDKKDEVATTPKKDSSDDNLTITRIYYDSTDNTVTENKTATGKEVPAPAIDDDGFSAQEVVNSFFNALNKKDCHTAWDLTYVSYWVNQGEDWFCSSNAFGGVTGVMLYDAHPIEESDTKVRFYAEYYAEDSYNGNKCFKQTITVEKLQYSDNKWRWKITRMENNSTPVECNGF